MFGTNSPLFLMSNINFVIMILINWIEFLNKFTLLWKTFCLCYRLNLINNTFGSPTSMIEFSILASVWCFTVDCRNGVLVTVVCNWCYQVIISHFRLWRWTQLVWQLIGPLSEKKIGFVSWLYYVLIHI